MMLLNYSIATFMRFFGEGSRYVVFTDDIPFVSSALCVRAEVRSFSNHVSSRFNTVASTWRKWAPLARLETGVPEFRIDLDMFLLKPPTELFDFCNGLDAEKKFLITTEEWKEDWPYGNFASSLHRDLAPINAGLVGQKPGADISCGLERAYDWWVEQVGERDVKYHDEQGAVAKALEAFMLRGEVTLLPSAKYRIVCPINESSVTNINDLTLLHATYPDHPAFYKYLPLIKEVAAPHLTKPLKD
ncbi:MAG: hypothetical protein ABL962_16770 [Fimbriimonadaceae bacterium]